MKKIIAANFHYIRNFLDIIKDNKISGIFSTGETVQRAKSKFSGNVFNKKLLNEI